MKRAVITIALLGVSHLLLSQNLLVNGGAESLPLGTGWTVVKAGANACTAAPTNTYSGWTMAPDGSANYPGARTGTRHFYPGCNVAVPESGFELVQSIDLSSFAGPVDLMGLTTVFTGYIQTPVNGQGDAGRFVIDFLNGSGTVLGTSFTSAWQSNAAGSGNTWNSYSSTRTAPVGTRSVLIRLQASIATGPAINAYFDDLSFVVTNTVPVRLTRFSGERSTTANLLSWTSAEEQNVKAYEVQRSADGNDWSAIGQVIAAGNSSVPLDYSFRDESPAQLNYYRLKMLDIDGSFTYSQQVVIRLMPSEQFTVRIFPNPATDFVNISTDFAETLQVQVVNLTGQVVLQRRLLPRNSHQLAIGKLLPGSYMLRVSNASGQSQSFKLKKM